VQKNWKSCGFVQRVREFFRKNCSLHLTNNSSLEGFDLSRNKLLRVLEFSAPEMRRWVEPNTLAFSSALNHAPSTITSPSVSKVTIFYRLIDLDPIYYHKLTPSGPSSLGYKAEPVTKTHRMIFKMVLELQEIRDFRLELRVDIWDPLTESAMRRLERIVHNEWAEGRGDYISSRPLVTCSPQGFLSVNDDGSTKRLTATHTRKQFSPWAPDCGR
jgi:hypothetical protein